MRIEIHTRNVEVDESLWTDIERRLGHAIGRFDEFIDRVSVHLANSNGMRGARQKRCRICVRLKSSGDVEIEDRDVDLCSVTARATRRVGMAVFEELWRLRESSRRSGRTSEE